jgi:hypothetical protein
MGYFILVIAQTVVLPIITAALKLTTSGSDPVLVFGKWWVFWGVGTRLLVAGLAQVSGRGPTAAILGATIPTVQEKQLTRELGMANVGMRLAGLLALVPGWALPAGLAGGVFLLVAFLLVAGIRHSPKQNKNAKEALATWTDLIVGAAVGGPRSPRASPRCCRLKGAGCERRMSNRPRDVREGCLKDRGM